MISTRNLGRTLRTCLDSIRSGRRELWKDLGIIGLLSSPLNSQRRILNKPYMCLVMSLNEPKIYSITTRRISLYSV